MAEILTDPEENRIADSSGLYSFYSPVARLIWSVLGVVETLLALRFLLRLFSANPTSGFTNGIYNITTPLISPFTNVFQATTTTTGIAEWSTVLTLIIYYLLAIVLVRLATMNRPVIRY